MKKSSNKGGLFARQKTIDKIRKVIFTVWSRLFIFLSVAVLMTTLSSCNKQSNGQSSQDLQKQQSKAAADSTNQPKVNIQVNKRYDDKGNLIGFDSTYTSFFSNVKGDTVRMDSLMQSFDRYFNLNHSSFLNRPFDTLFFNDPLRYPDFFHDDFFMKRYELNDEYFKGAMRRMDSIKNRFFYDQSKKWKDSKDL